MSMKIFPDSCANCGLCIEACPMAAVRRPTRENGLMTHEIDPARCTECVGHYAWPRCAALCRQEAIALDTDRFESRTTLVRKWRRFTGGNDYGEDTPSGLEPVQECGESGA